MALLLRQRGITRVRPLEGGLEAWRKLSYPLEDQQIEPPAAGGILPVV